MELAVIALFCLALAICIILNASVLFGLIAGLIIFCGYALWRAFTPRAIGRMVIDGVKIAKNVLIVFLCIGCLTGAWRMSGTVSALVNISAGCAAPATWVLVSFLSCGIVSFLMGTCFGTAATMGVVCLTMGSALGLDPMLVGGAALSGAMFGDRCSPVSSSALLTAELTGTTVTGNIPLMLKSAAVPTVACVIIYAALGALTAPAASSAVDGASVSVAAGFDISWPVFIPALLVLALSVVRLSAKWTLLASAAAAFVITLTLQGANPQDALIALVVGFTPGEGQSSLLAGGGVTSMLTPAAIVCIASAYAGIFKETGLLEGLQEKLISVGRRTTPFAGCLITSILTSAIACNQTLAIMLTHQIGKPLYAGSPSRSEENSRFALALEDSAVVIAPLFPWSIAGSVPLTLMGAPTTSLLVAFLLYLIPLWSLALSVASKKRSHSDASPW